MTAIDIFCTCSLTETLNHLIIRVKLTVWGYSKRSEKISWFSQNDRLQEEEMPPPAATLIRCAFLFFWVRIWFGESSAVRVAEQENPSTYKSTPNNRQKELT